MKAFSIYCSRDILMKNYGYPGLDSKEKQKDKAMALSFNK
jgi:hypothetical protein